MNDADAVRRRRFAQAFATLAIKASFSEGESRLFVEQVTGKSPMKAPTEQQLSDPAWWSEYAPEWATSFGIVGSVRSRIFYNVQFYQYFLQSERKLEFGLEHTFSLHEVEILAVRPTKPIACGTCGESPCGHYNECPPGMPKTEAAKPYSNTGLPRVGANSENSGLVISCVTPQVKSWEVLATRKGEAVVYAPACEENGTDQAEVYLMSAAEFKDPRAERERDDLLTDVLEGFRKSRAEPAATPELNLLSEFANYLYDAGMLRKGASDER